MYLNLIIIREKLGTILEKHCGTPNQSFIREHHPITEISSMLAFVQHFNLF